MQIFGQSIGLHQSFLGFGVVIATVAFGLPWAFPDQRWIGLYISAFALFVFVGCIKLDEDLWWRNEQIPTKKRFGVSFVFVAGLVGSVFAIQRNALEQKIELYVECRWGSVPTKFSDTGELRIVHYEKSQDGVFSVKGTGSAPPGTEYRWPEPRPVANECTLINYSDKVLTEITLNTEVTVLQRSTENRQQLTPISRSKDSITSFSKLDPGPNNAVKFYLLDVDSKYDFAVEFSSSVDLKILGENNETSGVIRTGDNMPWILNRDYPRPAKK
jgi:hypothetical protein